MAKEEEACRRHAGFGHSDEIRRQIEEMSRKDGIIMPCRG